MDFSNWSPQPVVVGFNFLAVNFPGRGGFRFTSKFDVVFDNLSFLDN